MTPTLLVPDSTPTCPNKSTTPVRITRFLELLPESLRADFLEVLRLWSRDRDTAGQVIDDLVARLRHDLPYLRDPQRRTDLQRLMQLLQAQRHAAILLVGRVKAVAS